METAGAVQETYQHVFSILHSNKLLDAKLKLTENKLKSKPALLITLGCCHFLSRNYLLI